MATPTPTPTAVATRGRTPWLTFALLAAAQFMVVLDAGIVYVALPSIQAELGLSQVGVAWVMDAYMLSFAGFLLLSGRAADLLGRRPVLLTGLALFAVASLLCAFSTEPWQLIAARGAQGLGAAVVSPTAMATIIDLFDGPSRYKALGLFGGVGGLAGATGTLFGGLLTSIDWQWTFLVNVPIVAVLLLLGLRMLPVGERRATGGVDVLGAVAGVGALCLLLYAVLQSGAHGFAGSTAVVAVGGLVLVGAFVVRQTGAPSPLIPRTLLRLRNVVLGNLANTAVGVLMFGTFLTVTLYLQHVRGYSPLDAGLRTAPLSIAVFLGSQVAVRLAGALTPVSVLAGGLATQALALTWWGWSLGPDGAIVPTFVLPGIVWGLGMGAAMVSAFLVCTTGVHPSAQGAAAGLVSTTLQVGGALGVATATTVAARQTAIRLDAPGADPLTALAAGQAMAFTVAALLAVVAVLVAVWLRSTWSGDEAPGPHASRSRPAPGQQPDRPHVLTWLWPERTSKHRLVPSRERHRTPRTTPPAREELA